MRKSISSVPFGGEWWYLVIQENLITDVLIQSAERMRRKCKGCKEKRFLLKTTTTDAAEVGVRWISIGFRLFILIVVRKVSGGDKGTVWGVNRSFRITAAHNRCSVCVCVCVCVCVGDNKIRPPPPLLVYLFSSLLSFLHPPLPPSPTLPCCIWDFLEPLYIFCLKMLYPVVFCRIMT